MRARIEGEQKTMAEIDRRMRTARALLTRH
jgi:hypothetical protein